MISGDVVALKKKRSHRRPSHADREIPPTTTMLNHFSGRVPIAPTISTQAVVESASEPPATMLRHSSGRAQADDSISE